MIVNAPTTSWLWYEDVNSDFEKGKKGIVKTQKLLHTTNPSFAFWPYRALEDMSDREGHSGAGPSDEDLSLPKATVAKMISGMCLWLFVHSHKFGFPNVTLSELLPNEVTCAKETRDLVIECCVGEHRQ